MPNFNLRTFLMILLLPLCLAASRNAFSQVERIEQTVDSMDAESHLRFLTSDEMRGRNTGTVELNIAGRYIAEQFRKNGLLPLGDVDGDYLQKVPMTNAVPAQKASVKMLGQEFVGGDDMLVVSGNNGTWNGNLVYFTNLEEAKGADLSGKIVVSVIQSAQGSASEDLSFLPESGAVALVQIYGPGQRFPWPMIMNYLNRERVTLDDKQGENNDPFPHVWVSDTSQVLLKKLAEAGGSEVSLNIAGMRKDPVLAFNIVGKIEGTDPELSKEHIVMCAHYDHIGVQSGEGQDSIYNGTRDNGVGTTGVLNAARYFSEHPPKRSIIFLALTGEEKGLLGSSYYASHPAIPLQETVLALNIDNSGYTDTEHLTLLDTNRVNIDPFVYQAAEEVGLKVMGDRIPNQNYFERSDQVSFARKGVPAINFKMAMETFDERISEFYHQPSDEFGSVDLPYIHKYWKAYIRSAELIGNWEERPYWIKGDKFEAAGDELYK